ncbi:MAG: hypothetical protein IKW48_09225 [Akkermansia sp.]|nr:hypothetical protein [Akkermansia sp.]
MTTDKASTFKLIVIVFFIIIAGLQIYGVIGWDSAPMNTQREAIEDSIQKIQEINTRLEEKIQKQDSEIQALPSEEDYIKQVQALKAEISSKQ